MALDTGLLNNSVSGIPTAVEVANCAGGVTCPEEAALNWGGWSTPRGLIGRKQYVLGRLDCPRGAHLGPRTTGRKEENPGRASSAPTMNARLNREAPRAGFEPATRRLTAGRSTVELSRNGSG